MLLMFTLSDITHWIHNLLSGFLSPNMTYISELVIAGITVILLVVLMAIASIYMERKVAAFMQMRLGPMRVGFWGSMQAFADVLKLLLKECLTPTGSDKFLFGLAPFIVLAVSFMAMVPMSYAAGMQLWDPNIGILYVTSVSSIGVIGVLMAGWSSNNKYSLLGAMRSGAQIVSYELSVGLSILAIIVMVGSLSMQDIIHSQASGWWIYRGHIPAIIAFVIFIIASTAELNRAPFDLAEAEQELTAGFHTEYSGMQFAMFFLAEYTNMFIVSMVGATIFLGGWMPLHFGSFEPFNHIMNFIPGFIWFFGKTFFIIFMIMWFRWTFPRLRIDQLLSLEWKYLLPLSLFNVLLAAFVTLMGWHF
jgi:NADH-quinone oxidoreductase subunit H